MIYDIDKKCFELLHTPSDINEHFPMMFYYGNQCEHITEMGVRGVLSTWAWLGSRPNKLVSYDLHDPTNWGGDIKEVYNAAKDNNILFEFKIQDVLKTEIEETDLLFLDTWHAYDQLKQELKLHSSKAKKFICFHDTTSCEFIDESKEHTNAWEGESSGKGIWPAIEEFLFENNKEWMLYERVRKNNGFTVIKRK